LALTCTHHAISLPLIQGDNPKAVRRQRPLQLEGRFHVAIQPCIKLGRLGQDLTGIAFEWTGWTTAFGSVVRNPYRVCSPSTGFFCVPRSPRHVHQIPANANNGRSSARANHVHCFRPVAGLGKSVGSQNEVAGTRQRNSGA
jgi:hypothetical protein